MPQHFLCALTLTATLMTTLTTKMTHEPHDHDRDGSKLALPHFDHKDPTYFDNLQAYAQDRGMFMVPPPVPHPLRLLLALAYLNTRYRQCQMSLRSTSFAAVPPLRVP